MSRFNGQLTTAGISRAALSSIVSDLEDAWKATYGADCDVDPRSADGQTIGVVAEMFDDLNALACDTANIANPNGATGAMLANLAFLTGIKKNGASYATAPCSYTGTYGTAVPYTFQVRSTADGTLWAPLQYPASQVFIGEDGTATGTLVCTTIGPLASGGPPLAATLTQIITITSGIDSVTNDVGVPGALIEGDANLRVRRQQSTAIASQGMTDGLQAALQALPGVAAAVVWENDTSNPVVIGSSAPPNSIGANSLWVIVQVTGEGAADPTGTSSSDDPVANTIFRLKGHACATQGGVSKAPLDAVGNTHPIYYDKATSMDVWVNVTVTKRVNWPTNGALLIKEAISAWAAGSNTTTGKPNIQIGGDDKGALSWTDVLASFLNSVPGFDFVSLQFSVDAGATWTTSPSSLQVPFKSFVSISNVLVNGV
jgi:hypothetical protein